MIDIQPYLNKLEALRGYMGGWIVYRTNEIVETSSLLDLYFQYGILFHRRPDFIPSFIEYYALHFYNSLKVSEQ